MTNVVSLVATVLNEREHLDRWLAAFEAQTRTPDEFIVVDGGSSDGTWERLIAWSPGFPVTLVRAPGASIATGRNIAMSRACGDVIAITDCGAIAEATWLQHLLLPFDDPGVDVVSGFFVPAQESAWDRSLAAATLPDECEIDPRRFLPSSRSVALRARWVRHGFEYPEWLDYCEDLVWDLQLREGGAGFQFEPRARVSFVVRSDWRAFWRQYYRYARGDGKAGLFGRRHVVRYATYAMALLVLKRRRQPELAVAALLAMTYVSRPLRRVVLRDRERGIHAARTAGAALLVPVHMAVGDAAKMAGYPAGLLWRRRRFGTLAPWTSWRRVTPSGAMWDPAAPCGGPQPPEGRRGVRAPVRGRPS